MINLSGIVAKQKKTVEKLASWLKCKVKICNM